MTGPKLTEGQKLWCIRRLMWLAVAVAAAFCIPAYNGNIRAGLSELRFLLLAISLRCWAYSIEARRAGRSHHE